MLNYLKREAHRRGISDHTIQFVSKTLDLASSFTAALGAGLIVGV
jgi:hypothetical protein